MSTFNPKIPLTLSLQFQNINIFCGNNFLFLNGITRARQIWTVRLKLIDLLSFLYKWIGSSVRLIQLLNSGCIRLFWSDSNDYFRFIENQNRVNLINIYLIYFIIIWLTQHCNIVYSQKYICNMKFWELLNLWFKEW